MISQIMSRTTRLRRHALEGVLPASHFRLFKQCINPDTQRLKSRCPSTATPSAKYVWAKVAQAIAPGVFIGNPYSLLPAENIKEVSLTLDKVVLSILQHVEWPCST